MKGNTVIYAACDSIKDTLDYDFATEKQFSYDYVAEENGKEVKRVTENISKGRICTLNCPLDELALLLKKKDLFRD